jgi:hypothetical protein
MDKPSLLDDLQARLARVMQDTPAADLQRNVRAILEQGLQRLDLVTREDLETYVQWAATMRQRVVQLEARIATLERERATSSGDAATAAAHDAGTAVEGSTPAPDAPSARGEVKGTSPV